MRGPQGFQAHHGARNDDNFPEFLNWKAGQEYSGVSREIWKEKSVNAEVDFSLALKRIQR